MQNALSNEHLLLFSLNGLFYYFRASFDHMHTLAAALHTHIVAHFVPPIIHLFKHIAWIGYWIRRHYTCGHKLWQHQIDCRRRRSRYFPTPAHGTLTVRLHTKLHYFSTRKRLCICVSLCYFKGTVDGRAWRQKATDGSGEHGVPCGMSCGRAYLITLIWRYCLWMYGTLVTNIRRNVCVSPHRHKHSHASKWVLWQLNNVVRRVALPYAHVNASTSSFSSSWLTAFFVLFSFYSRETSAFLCCG